MKQRFSSLDVKVIAHELSSNLVTLRLANVYDLSSKIFLQSWTRLPGSNYFDNLRGKPMYSGKALKDSIQEIVSERLTMKEKATLKELDTKPAEAPLASTQDPGCKT